MLKPLINLIEISLQLFIAIKMYFCCESPPLLISIGCLSTNCPWDYVLIMNQLLSPYNAEIR